MLAHAGYLLATVQKLWSREHYQFFPIVVIGVAVLAWLRLQDFVSTHNPGLSLRVVFYGTVSCLLFGTAAFLHSNWLGSLSMLASLWTLIWFVGGSQLASQLRGPCALLLLIVPLPLNLDLQLVLGLQKTATNFASSLLDMCGLRHAISGVAIKTLEKSFMVAEACSGVHSLFSCLCVMAVVCTLLQYGVIRVLLNLLQTVGWVIAANALRVFLIVYSYKVWGVSLESGWRHDLLGGSTYVLALLFSLSTDRLFLYLVPAHRYDSLTDMLNYGAGTVTTQVAQSIEGSGKSVKNFLNKPRLKEPSSTIVAFATVILIFFPVGALSASGFLRSAAPQGIAVNSEFKKQLQTAMRSADLLPASIGQWTLSENVAVDSKSKAPHVYTYTGSGLTVTFSVHRFFNTWNDVWPAYKGQGWKLEKSSDNENSGSHYARTISLYGDDSKHATSVSSCFDSQLRALEPTDAGSLVVLLLQRAGLKEKSSLHVPPVFQVELFCESEDQLLTEERQNLESLFFELSENVLTAIEETEVE